MGHIVSKARSRPTGPRSSPPPGRKDVEEGVSDCSRVAVEQESAGGDCVEIDKLVMAEAPPSTKNLQGELDRLARTIPYDRFYEVGTRLGFSLVELDNNIKFEHRGNVYLASLDMLMKWATREENATKEIIEHILRNPTPGPVEPPAAASRVQSTMTQKDLETYQARLKAHYIREYKEINTSPLDPDARMKQDMIFVNLNLLHEEVKESTQLKYGGIFELLQSSGDNKKFAFLGEAGVGKTTLLAKIAYDWATGQCLQEIDLLFLISLRDAQQARCFSDIANESVYKRDVADIAGEIVDAYIRKYPAKSVILFDGLDEYKGDVTQQKSSDVLVQIIRGERMMNTPLIVTTRPWRADQITSDGNISKQYTRVRVEGFKKGDSATYVRKFFYEDSTSAESLILTIENNAVIRDHLAHIPIFCAMLCHVWKDEPRRDALRKLQTLPHIFEEILQSMNEHYRNKCKAAGRKETLEGCLKRCTQAFTKIGKLAYDGLLSKHLLFREEEFDWCSGAVQTACEIGVISKKKRLASKDERKKGKEHVTKAEFPHKLMQECMAGFYVASLYESDPQEFHTVLTRVMEDYKEFEYLLSFVAAHGGEAGRAVMEALCKNVKNEDFIMRVAYDCHNETAIAPAVDLLRQRREFTIAYGLNIQYKYALAVSINRNDDYPGLITRPLSDDHDTSYRAAIGLISLPKLRKMNIHDDRDLDDAFWEGMAAGASQSQIQTLNLDYITLTAPRDLAFIVSLPRLQSLSLRLIDIGSVTRTSHEWESSDGSSVVELDVDDYSVNVICCLGFHAFPCPKVKKLTINNWQTNVKPASIAKMCSGFTNLIELHVRGVRHEKSLPDSASFSEAVMTSCPRLTKLSVTNVEVGNQKAADIIRSMEAHGPLKSISFTRCNTTDDLNTLCDEINRKGGLDVSITHGEAEEDWNF